MEPSLAQWVPRADEAARAWKAATGAAALLCALALAWWQGYPALVVVRPVAEPPTLVASSLQRFPEPADAAPSLLLLEADGEAEPLPAAPAAPAARARPARGVRAQPQRARPRLVLVRTGAGKAAPKPPGAPSRKPHYPYVRGPVSSGFPVT